MRKLTDQTYEKKKWIADLIQELAVQENRNDLEDLNINNVFKKLSEDSKIEEPCISSQNGNSIWLIH